MNYLDYIIDLERVIELTDNNKGSRSPYTSGGLSTPSSIIKQYLNIYTELINEPSNRRINTNTDKIEHVIRTLHYNKILISKSDIRDKTIDNVIKEGN